MWRRPLTALVAFSAMAMADRAAAPPVGPVTRECAELQQKHAREVDQKRAALRRGDQPMVKRIDGNLIELARAMNRLGGCPIPRYAPAKG